MEIDRVLKDYLKQQARIREAIGLPASARRFLEEEEKRRVLLEPHLETAKRLHESHLRTSELIKKPFDGKTISDLLRRNEHIWDQLTASASEFNRLSETSKTVKDAFNRLTEQSAATRNAFSSIAESITQKYSFETHLRLPQIETLLAKNLLARDDVEPFSISSLPDIDAAHQAIQDFIGYTEGTSDEEISQYFVKLARPAQLAILWFIRNVIVPLVVTILGSYYYDGWHLQEMLDNSPLSSSREVKQAIKNFPSDIDLSDFSEYKVVIGDRLHLRENPGMKSTVIEQIPRGKLVKVLEKGRTWTKVEVEFQESEAPLIGWVSTRYLTSLKR